MKPGVILVRDAARADELAGQVRASATKPQAWIALFGEVNQIWTYLAALSAVRVLFELHPGAGSFSIAPGAHAAQPLDVMSEVAGQVGAETFAAVDPKNNCKLAKDLIKLAGRAELYRYVFFASPVFPGTTRLPQLERGGVQVWSVDV